MNNEDIFLDVMLNNITEYKKWLSLNHNINERNDTGDNLLQMAIAYGNTEIGHDLILKGINVDNQNKLGQTPLHCSVEHDNIILTKEICDRTKNINVRDSYGNTPLWTATFNARESYIIVNLLVEKGGNPFLKNENNLSPYDFANKIEDRYLIKLFNHLSH